MKLRLIGTLTLMLVLVLGTTVFANEGEVGTLVYENWETEPNDSCDKANFMVPVDIGMNLGHLGSYYDQDCWMFRAITTNVHDVTLFSPTGKNYDLYIFEEVRPGELSLVGSSTNPEGVWDSVKVPGMINDSVRTYYALVVSPDGSYDPVNNYILIYSN